MREPRGRYLGIAVVIVFWLVVTPLAIAHHSEAQITDAEGDTRDVFTGEAVTETNLDILWVTFTDKTDSFTIVIKVADLLPNTPAAYRAAVTSQSWNVRWSVDGSVYSAHAGRDLTGGSFGAISPGEPNTENGEATLTFDDAQDKIILRFPRTFSTGLGGSTVSFPEDTVFENPTIETLEGLAPGSTSFGCAPCRQLDEAGPGEDFVLE